MQCATPRRGSTLWKMAVCIVLCLCGAASAWAQFMSQNWSPLFADYRDMIGTERTRAAGPFWESATRVDGVSMYAHPRPLVTGMSDPARRVERWELLWPLVTGRLMDNEQQSRWLITHYRDRDIHDPMSQYCFWLFPLWFQGRDAQTNRYAALFPVGGTIKDFLWFDETSFVLWPLWVRTRLKDVTSTTVLWPLFSRTTTPDDHLYRERVLPFWAYTRLTGQYTKKTVLWPLWTQADYTHPKATGRGWMLWPLAGRIHLKDQHGEDAQKTWMFLPPLFQFTKGKEMNRVYCPWPFYQRETGYRDRLYVWPFYGRRQDGDLRREFWAWPLVIREENRTGREHVVRWNLVPFYSNISKSEYKTLPKREASRPLVSAFSAEEGGGESAPAPKMPELGPVVANSLRVWPLFSRQYDLRTQSYRLRSLQLWPGPLPPSVERSWAPLWTLVDYSAVGESSDLDVLWGWYKYDRRPGNARDYSFFPFWRHVRESNDSERRWSFLKGLIAYDRNATSRTVRFLWLGRIRLKTAAAPASDDDALTAMNDAEEVMDE